MKRPSGSRRSLLPTDLYERLKEAAGDRGLGEEIRRRLEASFRSPTHGGPIRRRTNYSGQSSTSGRCLRGKGGGTKTATLMKCSKRP